jgi:glycosyltransferase involved in cell wall biosynthesis
MTRICFFGAYDPEYPRNRILLRGLERAGARIDEARVRDRRVPLRYPALARAFARHARDAEAILVPCFRHKDVPLARWLAGRRRLIFDPLVSRWDTLVNDWGKYRDGSFQSRWNRGIDRRAFSAADLVLCDTWAHGELFERLGAPRERLRRVLVGAEDAFFSVPDPPEHGPVRIVYIGGFLPLHGVSTILEAVARLERDGRSRSDFVVSLAGNGMQYEAARVHARALGLERVEFPGPSEYARAPELLAGAHVVLGAFGVSEKAGRVVPHKVYQGIAAGRAVVTGDGPGVREVFEPGVHLVTVPRGDPDALAAALARVIADRSWRADLGARGRARALEVATPEKIGLDLLHAIEGRRAR